MNILCKIFGHKPPVYACKGWWSPGEEYALLRNIDRDGTGRFHAMVFGKCARCENEFKICRVHPPANPAKGFPGEQA